MNIPLTELPSGVTGTITNVYGGRGLVSRLQSLGLAEGQRVRKVSRIALGGPIVVVVNRSQVAIGRGMARHILVHAEGGIGNRRDG